MPAPARTGRDQIVAVGGQLLEEGGPDAVTMQAVAQRVGVRAPSLYKHVRDRTDLLADLVAANLAELTTRMDAAQVEGDPRRSIEEQLRALRRFAQERPQGYAIVFGAPPGVPLPAPEALERSVRPVLAAVTALVGPEHALDGARLVTAWATGFLAMERAGALRLGGDIDGAWEWGLRQLAATLGAVNTS
jgi:AcrR family transcriptional regulator